MGTWCHLSLHLRHLLYLGAGGAGRGGSGPEFLTAAELWSGSTAEDPENSARAPAPTQNISAPPLGLWVWRSSWARQ